MEISIKIGISVGMVEVNVEIQQQQHQQQQQQQHVGAQAVLWTEVEANWLREGVVRFGYGNWWSILSYYPFHQSRTIAYLRDRAYQMRLYRYRVSVFM